MKDWGKATPESYDKDVEALRNLPEPDFTPFPVDAQLKRALRSMGCLHENHMNPSDFWGPIYSYGDILSLDIIGQSGKRAAAAGKKLRMILIDESENKPKDMEKYWTKPWEEIIEDDGDEKTS